MKPLFLTAGLLLAGSVSAAPCPTPPSWPTTQWPSRAAEVAAQKADAIRALEAYAFTLTGTDAERRGIRTDGVVVIHHGAIVYEKYAREHDASMRHLSWSVSKSFTNALVGRAVALGALSLDDSICKHLQVSGPDACRMTVKHLLEFSTGLDWAETYEGKSNQASSVLAMLYGEGQRDMGAFVASHAFRDAPGETFMYSSGDVTLLSSVLGEALRSKGVGEDFPWTLLFDKLGITSATWERDGKGHLVGSSYLYATPRDLARFGYLFLEDGCWAGERLLPEGWVADSTAVSEPFKKRALEVGPEDVQGRLWWLNRAVPEQGITTRPWPDVPEDAYAARGHWGQSITVIPSLDVVVVRTADDREPGFELNRFLSLALALVR